MAADDRRIITGAHVVVKEGNLPEDVTETDGTENGRKWVMWDNINKHLGGKSIVTDIAATQDFAGGNNWYQGDNKSTALSVTSVTKPTGTTTADTGAAQFLYVRNLDTTLDCYVSLTTATTWTGTYAQGADWELATGAAKGPSYDPRWDEGMYIIVPPGGSVQLRGDQELLHHVRFSSSTPTTAINVEYVLAE